MRFSDNIESDFDWPFCYVIITIKAGDLLANKKQSLNAKL